MVADASPGISQVRGIHDLLRPLESSPTTSDSPYGSEPETSGRPSRWHGLFVMLFKPIPADARTSLAIRYNAAHHVLHRPATQTSGPT